MQPFNNMMPNNAMIMNNNMNNMMNNINMDNMNNAMMNNNMMKNMNFNGMNNNNNIMNNNINVINKINSKTLNINKLVINFKDKCPEKKFNLKSINSHDNRLPSANSSKTRESGSYNISSITSSKTIINRQGNNILLEDNNSQLLNGTNQNNIGYNFLKHSGRIVIKDMINNDYSNNVYNVNKSIHSSKNVKTGLRVMKMKKESYLKTPNKITINAKTNEINKSNK
jgi:hypothetical protein